MAQHHVDIMRGRVKAINTGTGPTVRLTTDEPETATILQRNDSAWVTTSTTMGGGTIGSADDSPTGSTLAVAGGQRGGSSNNSALIRDQTLPSNRRVATRSAAAKNPEVWYSADIYDRLWLQALLGNHGAAGGGSIGEVEEGGGGIVAVVGSTPTLPKGPGFVHRVMSSLLGGSGGSTPTSNSNNLSPSSNSGNPWIRLFMLEKIFTELEVEAVGKEKKSVHISEETKQGWLNECKDIICCSTRSASSSSFGDKELLKQLTFFVKCCEEYWLDKSAAYPESLIGTQIIPELGHQPGHDQNSGAITEDNIPLPFCPRDNQATQHVGILAKSDKPDEVEKIFEGVAQARVLENQLSQFPELTETGSSGKKRNRSPTSTAGGASAGRKQVGGGSHSNRTLEKEATNKLEEYLESMSALSHALVVRETAKQQKDLLTLTQLALMREEAKESLLAKEDSERVAAGTTIWSLDSGDGINNDDDDEDDDQYWKDERISSVPFKEMTRPKDKF